MGTTSDRPTIPFHIWKYEVELRVIRSGYSADEIKAVVDNRGLKPSLWWNCGEPIETAADTIIAFCRGARQASQSWEESNKRILHRSVLEQRARALGKIDMSPNGDFEILPPAVKGPS